MRVNHKASRGAILIIVLIFCLITAVIAQGAMEVGILQLKMANNFKKHLDIKKDAQNELEVIENQLANEIKVQIPQTTFLQFVPDTLKFAESQGVNFYRIAVEKQDEAGSFIKLASTFCVREMQIQNESIMNDQQLAFINNLNLDKIADVKILHTHSDHNLLLIAHEKNANKSTQLSFVRFPQAEIVRSFNVNSKLSSKLLVADTKSLGKADYVYFGTQKGELVSIAIDSPFTDEWVMTTHKDLIEGEIIGTPIIGRHPQGRGFLLYCLVENNNQRSIQVFSHSLQEIKPFYFLESNEGIGQPLLWQGYIVAANSNNNNVGVYDAFTGNLLEKIPLQQLNENNVPLQDDAAPVVVVNQPLDKNPQIIISTRNSQKFCESPILANRLGRKTWGVG